MNKARKFRKMPSRETLDKTLCKHCNYPADTICDRCSVTVCHGCSAHSEDVTICNECAALMVIEDVSRRLEEMP